tara:strand:+ start:1406 stop:1846 length:441 start_codon:yes stop_codon:yes gene_type:complete
MKIKTKKNNKYETKSSDNKKNGYLIPIYNKKENFFSENGDPQQVYLTVVKTNCIKGPHLHKVRKGFFTCIRGNIRIILKVNNKFIQYYSGEDYEYLSVEIPTNVGAAIQNIGSEDAFVLNMPTPAWDPDMNDEFTDDFSDFDFSII